MANPLKNKESPNTDVKLIWTGPRESDVIGCDDLFSGHITLYGDKDSFCQSALNFRGNDAGKTRRINHNDIHPEQDLFILVRQIGFLLTEKDGSAHYFMSYNPNFVARDLKHEYFWYLATLMKLFEDADGGSHTTNASTDGGRSDRGGCIWTRGCKGAGSDTRNVDKYCMLILGDAPEKVDGPEYREYELVREFIDSEQESFGIGMRFIESLFGKPLTETDSPENDTHRWVLRYFISELMKKKAGTDNDIDGIETLYRHLDRGKGLEPEEIRICKDYTVGFKTHFAKMDALCKAVLKRTLCLNRDSDLMSTLDNKKRFRDLCKEIGIPTTENILLDIEGKDCTIPYLKSRVDGNAFVVQKTHSSGGFGTFVFKEPSRKDENEMIFKSRMESLKDRVRRSLSDCERNSLVLSRYREPNISVNIHAVILDDDILISPGSIQIITETTGRLIYSGADYIAFKNYSDEEKIKVRELNDYVAWISKALQGRGYRGIIGYDVIISDRIEFVEANNRFQASTAVLNKALANRVETCGRGCGDGDGEDDGDDRISMQKLNLYAFYDKNAVEDRDGPLISPVVQNDIIRRILKRSEEEMGNHPMSRIDFLDLIVDYSCFIYYNENDAVAADGGEEKTPGPGRDSHAKHIWRCVDRMSGSSGGPRAPCHVFGRGDGERYSDGFHGFGNDDEDDVMDTVDEGAYLFKVLFETNIVSVINDRVTIHPNIPDPSPEWNKRIVSSDGGYRNDNLLALKIGLINNGLRISDGAKRAIVGKADVSGPQLDILFKDTISEGVNSSLDMKISCAEFEYNGVRYNELPVNCMYDNFISDFSPFEMDVLDDGGGKRYCLKYYGHRMVYGKGEPIGISYFCNTLESVKNDGENRSEIPLGEVAFIATDRIRFQHSDCCAFASANIGCKFCEFTAKRTDDQQRFRFGEEEIKKIVHMTLCDSKPYKHRRDHRSDSIFIDHVLIGGGTFPGTPFETKKRILSICRAIHEERQVPIYLMCTPPGKMSDMDDYAKAGVTEVGFNIEIYTRTIASRYMPGKSRMTLAAYISALKYATNVWTKPGAVRSALILGLEPPEGTIEGVNVLASIGVSPMLSVFRPTAGTDLGHVQPMSSQDVYDLFIRCYTICKDLDIELGPSCIHCQNNTVALPSSIVDPIIDAESRNRDRR